MSEFVDYAASDAIVEAIRKTDALEIDHISKDGGAVLCATTALSRLQQTACDASMLDWLHDLRLREVGYALAKLLAAHRNGTEVRVCLKVIPRHKHNVPEVVAAYRVTVKDIA